MLRANNIFHFHLIVTVVDWTRHNILLAHYVIVTYCDFGTSLSKEMSRACVVYISRVLEAKVLQCPQALVKSYNTSLLLVIYILCAEIFCFVSDCGVAGGG